MHLTRLSFVYLFVKDNDIKYIHGLHSFTWYLYSLTREDDIFYILYFMHADVHATRGGLIDLHIYLMLGMDQYLLICLGLDTDK